MNDYKEVLTIVYRYLKNLNLYFMLSYSLNVEYYLSNFNIQYLQLDLDNYNYHYDLEVIDKYLIIDLVLEDLDKIYTLKVYNLNKTSLNEVLLDLKQLVLVKKD